MKNLINLGSSSINEEKSQGIGRRKFFFYGAAALSSVALISACKDSNDDTPSPSGGVNLGSGDIGVLNYAYALEQLEAAFYAQVIKTPYSGISAGELAIMSDIARHEESHRLFFKSALGTSAIQDLEVDFSKITFSSRDSVLGTAKAFEDLGVSAYNGAGKLIANVDYLLAAGKIVSVEARHAAVIRDLLSPKTSSFADTDVVNSSGLDMARTPAEVLAIAGTYLKTKVNASNLPTS